MTFASSSSADELNVPEAAHLGERIEVSLESLLPMSLTVVVEPCEGTGPPISRVVALGGEGAPASLSFPVAAAGVYRVSAEPQDRMGELPMAVTWRLERPLSGDLFATFAAAVA